MIGCDFFMNSRNLQDLKVEVSQEHLLDTVITSCSHMMSLWTTGQLTNSAGLPLAHACAHHQETSKEGLQWWAINCFRVMLA